MGITPAIIHSLCRGVKIGNQRFEYPKIWFKKFRQKSWLSTFIRYTPVNRSRKKSRAAYSGYCPDCLTSDLVPYWRFPWRMRHWVVCPKHSCVIRETCPHCEKPIFVNSLSLWWEKSPNVEPICGLCPSCRKFLSIPDFTVRLDHAAVQELVAFQNAVTSALVLGSFQVRGISGHLPIESLPSFLATIAIPDPYRKIAAPEFSSIFQTAFKDAFSETRLPRFSALYNYQDQIPSRLEALSTNPYLPAISEYVIKSKFRDPLMAIIKEH